MEKSVWKLEEYGVAKISNKFYAKIQITKDDRGVFWDDKVLGYHIKEDGTTEPVEKLCYYMEIVHKKVKLWLPAESLRIIERPRPFYGPAEKPISPIKSPPKKRIIHEDYTLPVTIPRLHPTKVDLNTTYYQRYIPEFQDECESEIEEYVRLCKLGIVYELADNMKKDPNKKKEYDALMKKCNDPNLSVSHKMQLIIETGYPSEKALENYLLQCWKYTKENIETHVYDEGINTYNEDSKNSEGESNKLAQHKPVHTNWCLVCGKRDDLVQCPKCPSCFHMSCKSRWGDVQRHRELGTKATEAPVVKQKRLSSTRVVESYSKDIECNVCPSCLWGPQVTYGDIVWYKYKRSPWWPAKILFPGTLPSCLVTSRRSEKNWALKYYGHNNYSWGDDSRLSPFLPSHDAILSENKPEDLKDALMDACDDYIRVYLC